MKNRFDLLQKNVICNSGGFSMVFPTRLFSLILFIAIVIFGFIGTLAQKKPGRDKVIRPPRAEKFTSISEVAVPWRMTECHPISPEPDCPRISREEFQNAGDMRMFDADGSLWYRFSLDRKSPEYFLTQAKAEFAPFATYPSLPVAVFLRIVAESPNWYKVEVNEKTRVTKYISKSDKSWTAAKWESWLQRRRQIKVDFDKTPMKDLPGGKVIEPKYVGEYQVTYIKADGDWAYIKLGFKDVQYGWIQWKKGRDLLIGCAYNNFEVPSVRIGMARK
jgi:hypothetical protein